MKRRRIRLRYFDYRQTAVYFVTICTHRRQPTLGSIQNDVMQLSRFGHLAASRWTSIPDHAPSASLDLFVVMPNHIHGLLCLESTGLTSELRRSPGELRPGSLGSVIGGFKASVTRIARDRGIIGPNPAWQRGFWEHIVRGPKALERIRRYIAENPSRWYCDAENYDRRETDPFDVWIVRQ